MTTRIPPTTWLLVFLLPVLGTTCPSKSTRTFFQKVHFDITGIDDHGLRNGEVAVDYEYCIPADKQSLDKVRAIDPNVRCLETARGRIGCSKSEWLCISSTHGPDWKDRLGRLASLPFIHEFREVHYE